jgi:hypothetical protein
MLSHTEEIDLALESLLLLDVMPLTMQKDLHPLRDSRTIGRTRGVPGLQASLGLTPTVWELCLVGTR